MTAGPDILSTTLQIIHKEAINSLYVDTPILSAMRQVGGVVPVQGGSKYTISVVLAPHSSGTTLTTGYEPLTTTVGDGSRSAEYEWFDHAVPVVITSKERLSNRGPTAIVNLAKTKHGNVMDELQEKISRGIIFGGEAGLNSLNGVDGATGYLEELAFGSQTNTVGGIAKSAFPLRWQNQVATAGGAFATNGQAAMNSLGVNCKLRGGQAGLVLLSANAFQLYQGTLQAQERYTTKDALDGGRMSLMFAGAPVYADVDLGFTGDGGTVVSGYFIDPKGLKLAIDTAADFTLSNFEHVGSQDVEQAIVRVRLQLAAGRLNTQGILLDAEA